MNRSDGGADIVMKHIDIRASGGDMPAAAANVRKYRTTKDILVPKGTNVVFISRMKQDVVRLALAHISIGADMHYEWWMYFDDALARGMIEEVPSADPV